MFNVSICSSVVTLIATNLIENSVAFTCDPMPDDKFEISVKDEARGMLERCIRSINVNENAEDSSLGLERALKELEDDDELKLWVVEIGLFDLDGDPDIPFESHNIYVAAECRDDAIKDAMGIARDNIAIVDRVVFSPCCEPSEVNKVDFGAVKNG